MNKGTGKPLYDEVMETENTEKETTGEQNTDEITSLTGRAEINSALVKTIFFEQPVIIIARNNIMRTVPVFFLALYSRIKRNHSHFE